MPECKSKALQLLAHAYHQPDSDAHVQVHHQQPARASTKPAHLNTAHTLAVNFCWMPSVITHDGLDSSVLHVLA